LLVTGLAVKDGNGGGRGKAGEDPMFLLTGDLARQRQRELMHEAEHDRRARKAKRNLPWRSRRQDQSHSEGC